MYDYSPIETIYIKNFRNIGEVEIDFKESPIICLVGENEAGKTSVIKAFEVCSLHANPRDQKDYIRDGTKMFGVAIKLQDGTMVKRVKMDSVNKYSVEYPNGDVWDATKLDGLPVQVQKVMGLIEEPETKEFLHIRTYEDKLLFVVTPASTNYKVMYDALKVDQLTRAIKKGSVEANALRTEINSNEDNINAFTNTIKGIKIYDISILQKVRDRVQSQLLLLDKLDRAMKLKMAVENSKKTLGSLSAIEDGTVQEIDVNLASKLLSVNRLLNKRTEIISCLNSLKDVENLTEIDTSVLEKLNSVIERNKKLLDKKSRAESLTQLNELREINENQFNSLFRAVSLLNRLETLRKQGAIVEVDRCKEITQEDVNVIYKLSKVKSLDNSIKSSQESVNQIDNYIKQVMDYIEQCGVAVTTCPNCGESVVIDKDIL